MTTDLNEDTFSIVFSTKPSSDVDGEYAVIELQIGSYVEDQPASLNFWTCGQYEEQWAAALKQVLSEKAKSALIVDMNDPKLAVSAWLWPMWREGDILYLQNRLLSFSELEEQFEPARIADFIGPHLKRNDEGQEISHWQIKADAVSRFLLHRSNAYSEFAELRHK